MANIELARAYVTIVPSMEGAQETIASELSGVDFSSQGSAGGADFGDAFSSALLGAGSIALSIGSQIASGLAEGATALANFTAQGGAYADEVLTMSTNTHIATEDLQAYMYAAELVDVSTETLTSSMARNVRSMNSAADGTGAVADAYAALGVAVTDSDGNLRDSQTVYWELIDALGQVDDYTQRDALSMQIFGRSAQDLNSLIAVGSDGMAQYAQQAQQAGAILDGDTLEAFGAFDDVTHQLDSGMQAAQNALGTILLPILTDLSGEGVSLLNEFTNAVLDTDGDVSQLGEVIDTMVPQVLSILDEYLPVLFELGTSIIGTLASSILDNLSMILDSAGSLILALAQGIIDHLGDGELASTITSLILSLVNFLVSNLPTVVSAATQIIIAVTQGLASAAPELIPAIIDCIILMNETMLQNLDIIISAAQQLLLGIIEGLVLATPDILAAIPTLISEMLEEFGQLGPQLASNALEWGIDMVQNLIDGVRSMFGNLSDAASNLASCISDYLHFSVPEKGPLSDMDVHGGAGLVRSFIEGIEDGSPELEATLNRTLSLPTMAAPELISDMSGTGGNIVIPVNIGQERLDTILIRADQLATYRRGN